MKIIKSQTKFMLFNMSKTVDVLSEVKFEEGLRIEFIREMKV